ncbi:MAG: hypothetical protein MZV63_13320 [Marinilabiliales bacterium]|nr:hypothetical protein [Marinilabiliales bacterium]
MGPIPAGPRGSQGVSHENVDAGRFRGVRPPGPGILPRLRGSPGHDRRGPGRGEGLLRRLRQRQDRRDPVRGRLLPGPRDRRPGGDRGGTQGPLAPDIHPDGKQGWLHGGWAVVSTAYLKLTDFPDPAAYGRYIAWAFQKGERVRASRTSRVSRRVTWAGSIPWTTGTRPSWWSGTRTWTPRPGWRPCPRISPHTLRARLLRVPRRRGARGREIPGGLREAGGGVAGRAPPTRPSSRSAPG